MKEIYTNKDWINVLGTSDRRCNCGTWKEHWRKGTNEGWPKQCSIEGCTNMAMLGAHVRNNSVIGEHIVPMCDACNKLSEKFNIKSGTIAVSANKSLTCQ